MPVSVMKFLRVKSPASTYHLICFAFGGQEKFFAEKGVSTPLGYVAAIVIGPNSALLVDTKYGNGQYATEKAGFFSGDIAAACEYILKHFDNLPEHGVMTVIEQSADCYGFTVKEVVEE